jgi:hypothetical protein
MSKSTSKLLRERTLEVDSREGHAIFACPTFEPGDIVISAWMVRDWKIFTQKRLLETQYLQMVVKIHPGWTEGDGRVTCWKMDSRWFRTKGLGEVHKGGASEGFVKVTEAIDPQLVRTLLAASRFNV